MPLLTHSAAGANHNGGKLQFGPDGYLYMGMGDGGGGCDDAGPGCNAQRDNQLLGKILRLDVNQSINDRRGTASRPPIRSSVRAIRATRSGRTVCAIRGASPSTA